MTTSEEIAIGNLDAQVDSARNQYLRTGLVETRTQLFELLSLRVQLLGQVSDLEELQRLGHEANQDEHPKERLLFARALLAIHKFSEAQIVLRELDDQGIDTAAVQLSLDLALHQNLEFWLEYAEDREAQWPSYETASSQASVLLTLGRFDEADSAFQRAEDRYGDVSPFPLAWLSFQRGLMWSERAGDAARGRFYYGRALDFLPSYVIANVHLAELELDSNDPMSAFERFDIASQSEDPEPWGKLASFYAVGNPELSAAWREQAADTYEQLLGEYPLAFADHASEFFREPGQDPERAWDLALTNLANRLTPRSLLVAWAAAVERGNTTDVCALIELATYFDAQHPVLAEERARIRASCDA